MADTPCERKKPDRCHEYAPRCAQPMHRNMVLTDLPYNVAYQGKTRQQLTIDNDALGETFDHFLHAACANTLAVCQGALYICMSSSELHTLYQAFTEAGGHWSTFRDRG